MGKPRWWWSKKRRQDHIRDIAGWDDFHAAVVAYEKSKADANARARANADARARANANARARANANAKFKANANARAKANANAQARVDAEAMAFHEAISKAIAKEEALIIAMAGARARAEANRGWKEIETELAAHEKAANATAEVERTVKAAAHEKAANSRPEVKRTVKAGAANLEAQALAKVVAASLMKAQGPVVKTPVVTSEDPPTQYVLDLTARFKNGDLDARPAPPWADMARRYQELKFIGGGGQASVFKATRNGKAIAVRVTAMSLRFASITFNTICGCYLAKLNSRVGDSRTDYFQQVYAVYYSNPSSVISQDYHRSDICCLCEEVELMDSDWTRGVVTDNLILESCIGVWAGIKFANIYLGDAKYRNFGIKRVNFWRCYHHQHQVFTFPPGPMAKRVDLDGYRADKPMRQRALFTVSNLNTGLQTARAVVRDVAATPDQLFVSMGTHAPYLNVLPPPGASVVHYNLD